MKKIKININSENAPARIQAVLDDVQRRAKVRTIDVEDIISDLAYVDQRLGLPKTAKKGITVCIDHHAQYFPGAYRGRPESTFVCATYTGTTWQITDIYRDYTGHTQYRITHTEDSKAAIIRNHTYF